MKDQEAQNDFGYMEELSKAYEATFAKRLARPYGLEEEKRELIAAMQSEIKCAAERAYASARSEESKELLLMLRESAEECLHVLSLEEMSKSKTNVPDGALLSHALILANRSYNLLLRHTRECSPLTMLILSELSALYALAAIR